MPTTHQQAFEWLQMERDHRLDEHHRRLLRAHLNTCPTCQANAALNEQLSTRLPAPKGLPLSKTSPAELVQAARSKGWSRPRPWAAEVFTWAAWTAAAVLLVLMLSWSLEHTRPGMVSTPIARQPEPSGWSLLLPSPKPAAEPAAPSENTIPLPRPDKIWLQILILFFRYFFFAGLAFPVALSLLGIWLAQRKEDLAWLVTLVSAITLLLIVMALAMRLADNAGMTPVFIFPWLISAISLYGITLWERGRLWPSSMLWLAIIFGVGVLVIGVLISFIGGGWTMSMAAFGGVLAVFGLLPVAGWQAFKQRGAMQVLVVIFVAILAFLTWLSLLPISTPPINRYPWVETFTWVGLLGWILLAGPLFTRLVASLPAASAPASRSRFLLTAILALFTLLTLYAGLRTAAIRDSVSEDAITGVFLAHFAIISLLTVAVSLAWNLNKRALWARLAWMTVLAAVVTAAIIVPRGTAARLTARRAQVVAGAVQQYYNEHGEYPDTLDELVSTYIWMIPEPLTFFHRTWCYASDRQGYSLGYFLAYEFTHPSEVILEVASQAGSPPPPLKTCSDELQAW